MCSCNKKVASKRQPVVRNLGIQSVGQNSDGASPTQIRALGLQSNNTAPKSASKLSADRLKIEKIRRLAIQKAFNK